MRAGELKIGAVLAMRARFPALATGLSVLLVLSAVLASLFSPRQLSTVSLDVGLSVLRLGLPLIAVFMVQELVFREFDRRHVLMTLTYPFPRRQWLISRLSAVVLLTFLLTAINFLLLGATVYLLSGTYSQSTPVSLGLPYLVTFVFAYTDFFVVTAVAALLAVTARTGSFILIGSLGFMVIARSYLIVIQMLLDNEALVQGIADVQTYTASLDWLSFVFPDLGSLDVRAIALYGRLDLLPEQWPYAMVGSLAYGVLALVTAAWSLERRELS